MIAVLMLNFKFACVQIEVLTPIASNIKIPLFDLN